MKTETRTELNRLSMLRYSLKEDDHFYEYIGQLLIAIMNDLESANPTASCSMTDGDILINELKKMVNELDSTLYGVELAGDLEPGVEHMTKYELSAEEVNKLNSLLHHKINSINSNAEFLSKTTGIDVDKFILKDEPLSEYDKQLKKVQGSYHNKRRNDLKDNKLKNSFKVDKSFFKETDTKPCEMCGDPISKVFLNRYCIKCTDRL